MSKDKVQRLGKLRMRLSSWIRKISRLNEIPRKEKNSCGIILAAVDEGPNVEITVGSESESCLRRLINIANDPFNCFAPTKHQNIPAGWRTRWSCYTRRVCKRFAVNRAGLKH